ncbi:MAG: 2-aminoadipate transaminase [Candidatus Azotimanducaceae bacterium]
MPNGALHRPNNAMTIFDFAVGQTNPETFPVAAFADAARRAIEKEHDAYNQYPGPKGHPGLRRLMADRESEREGVYVDPECLALTNGSMQAVTLVGQALKVADGDTVITEMFTYSGTISAYEGIGLNLIGVGLDEEGMRIDLLVAAIEAQIKAGKKPRFIYTLTRYQNPTGTCMSIDRRRQLLEVAKRFDITVVEDNCYGDVHFEGEIEPSLFAMDSEVKHIYIGSLSKIFAPGVRLGYLYAQEPLFSSLIARRFDAGSNYFAASVLAEFYADGIQAHAAKTLPALMVKKALLLNALERELVDVCVWSKPRGGLFLWLRLPQDTNLSKLTALCDAQGFKFAPGSDFHVDHLPVPYLRLAFGHVRDELIDPGIALLAGCIAQARMSNAPREFESLF